MKNNAAGSADGKERAPYPWWYCESLKDTITLREHSGKVKMREWRRCKLDVRKSCFPCCLWQKARNIPERPKRFLLKEKLTTFLERENLFQSCLQDWKEWNEKWPCFIPVVSSAGPFIPRTDWWAWPHLTLEVFIWANF